METYIVKIQSDISGNSVLIYDQTRDLFHQEVGADAVKIMETYGLDTMSKTFAKAEVDENGLLHLGVELDDQGW